MNRSARRRLAQIEWSQRIAQHLLPGGSVIVPPRIAAWLEKKSGMLPERRIMLLDTDPEAYAVLTALHVSAMGRHDSPGNSIRPISGAPSEIGQQSAKGRDSHEQLEEWLTTVEAAEIFGVHDRTIRRWIAAQRLPARRHSGRWLVNRQHLNIARAQAARPTPKEIDTCLPYN